jgi:hypothetical protein
MVAKIGISPTLPSDMRSFVVARTEILPVPLELMLKLPVSCVSLPTWIELIPLQPSARSPLQFIKLALTVDEFGLEGSSLCRIIVSRLPAYATSF